jgi:response regulator RpfG family c-di-GMP phosphodiesterase
MAMGKNLDKNINIEELKAQAEKRKQDAELELQRVEQLQQEQKEAEKQQKIDERQALLDNVATFMAQSRQEALAGNLAKAETLKGFAEDAKKLASEIVIEGEQSEELETELPTEPFFGKGYSVARRWILTTLFTLALFAISSYLNHL